VVVNKINIESFAVLESKDNSPVGSYGHGPKPSEFPLQRVEPKQGLVQALDCLGCFKSSKDLPDSPQHVGWQSAPVILLVKLPQSFVSECRDHWPPRLHLASAKA
jgi:hypothetical protein